MLLTIIPNLTIDNATIGGTTESKTTIIANKINPIDRYENFLLKIPVACLAFIKKPIPLNIRIERMKRIKK